ncbi:M23 family metallopeptidase [Solimonas terrae]|uniref:M23 family metallopeptidase n=1 Tax=Solimonas terrae TaxID=1396819 RepID=A0A6M2BWR2_9GAMM|nr:M23 family metallopeptidase [Solimonas terrae]NGY06834.1 M23 family metallopeptidase [Solimonas terrae]
MRALIAAALLFATILTASAASVDELPAGVSLRGDWQEGEVLFGKAPAGSKLWFDDRALRLTPAGDFVFGINRDAPDSAELRVQLPGAAVVSYRHAVARREYDIQHIDGLPPKMVSPPPGVYDRIRADQREVSAARKYEGDSTGFLEHFIWPATGRISGVYGSQRILNGEPKQPHYGVDVAVPIGTEVHAPADGVVVLANPDMYFTGGTLMIDHGYGLQSAFLHLSRLLVGKGQQVRQGDVIALSGMTGRATGPHLDWRMNWYEARVDAQKLAPPMPAAATP